eukprot:TRINITY_DN3838_c1_g2_i2.p1 TRINITY_DN3838_c1_g2~~TRINITY_DN3838_c1_g2_i2.p1  ORF type:complete len:223 (-),score=42.12 TRINITY_DN3838_c1_g2_i2:64-732(-)
MKFAEQITSCAAALDDRGMMGSAFEGHFKCQVRRVLALSNPSRNVNEENENLGFTTSAANAVAILSRDDGEIFDFDVMDIKEFLNDSDLSGTNHIHGQWLFTMNKHHGGFDLIYIHEKDGKFEIYFFQITISDDHELKCKYFSQAAKVIAGNILQTGKIISKIVVAGLVTYHRVADFCFTAYTVKDLKSIGEISHFCNAPVEIKIFYPFHDPYYTYKFKNTS